MRNVVKKHFYCNQYFLALKYHILASAPAGMQIPTDHSNRRGQECFLKPVLFLGKKLINTKLCKEV